MSDYESDEVLVERAKVLVKAIRNFDLVVTQEGTRTKYTKAIDIRNPKEKKTKTYSDWLALAMSAFELWLTSPPEGRDLPIRIYAMECLHEIDSGITNRYLVPGQGLITKWEKAEAENLELRNQLAGLEERLNECGDRVVTLETENQKLRERNPVFGIAQGSVDDLGENPDDKKGE